MNWTFPANALKRARVYPRLLLTTGVLLLCVMTPSAHAASPYTTNGIFLDHGFDSNTMSDSQIQSVVLWLKKRQFTYQLHNITAFNSDGTMNPANYSQLAHWIQVSRAADPSQKIIVYLSGTLALVNTPSAWQNMAAVCQLFVAQYAVDGVNLDFEPYTTDNVANYEGFFSAVRTAIGASTQLSLDYTADSAAQWTPADFNAISQYFDLMMPMLYDSSCRTVACYGAFVDQAVIYDYANKASTTQIYPLIPTYARSSTHDPSVENIQVSATEVLTLIASGQVQIADVGVWWYFGWNKSADADWRTYWLDQ